MTGNKQKLEFAPSDKSYNASNRLNPSSPPTIKHRCARSIYRARQTRDDPREFPQPSAARKDSINRHPNVPFTCTNSLPEIILFLSDFSRALLAWIGLDRSLTRVENGNGNKIARGFVRLSLNDNR